MAVALGDYIKPMAKVLEGLGNFTFAPTGLLLLDGHCQIARKTLSDSLLLLPFATSPAALGLTLGGDYTSWGKRFRDGT